MEAMQDEMRTMRSERAAEMETQVMSPESVTAQPLSDESDDSDSQPASPESLRRDRKLMREAVKRLSRLRLDDEDDDLVSTDGSRNTGKKSGSVMTATDKVRKAVDWPHMYVRRLAKGNRKGITFAELRVEEFVFGFLKMLLAPKCKLDSARMIDMLMNIMQDAMEFSWPSARNFYEQVGINVEMGMIKWTDDNAIEQLRMQYARTVFPVAKETKDYAKAPLVQAPPNTRCCVAFQQKTCEQDRDHQPFVHACAYCLKSKSVLCRHPEADCYRKIK